MGLEYTLVRLISGLHILQIKFAKTKICNCQLFFSKTKTTNELETILIASEIILDNKITSVV